MSNTDTELIEKGIITEDLNVFTNISLEGLVYHVANLAGLYLSYFITAITEIL